MEFEVRDLSEPIRQGDVIQWLQPTSPWDRFGVVVTADCDIAQGKHRGVLSYSPVLTLDDYLSQIWLGDHVRKQLRAHLPRVRKLLLDAAKISSTGFQGISDDDVIPGWVLRRGPAGIMEDIGVDSARAPELLDWLSLIDLGAHAVEAQDVEEVLSAAVRMRAGSIQLSTEDLERGRERLWDQLHSSITSLPGEFFFLNAIGPDLADGYLVHLRRIREVDAAHVAIDPVQQSSDNTVRGIRLTAIASPYKYRLVQQMTAVFADIGLPDEYTIRCKDTVRNRTTRIQIG
jgi:hypothetical protein